jgi:hypothetical protein
MSKNLLNKYVWLVETIYKAKSISLEEINKLWLEEDMSEGAVMPRKTFNTWKNQVEELFGIIINCERKGGYHYYIENADDIKNGGLRSWLLSTISVSNLLIDNKNLSDRIILENVPSGNGHLERIIGAMKNSKVLEITYQRFEDEISQMLDVAPYCVKLFRQRWYMVAIRLIDNKIRIYSLDRIHKITITTDTFAYPDDFNPEAYFDDCFGIIHVKDVPIEKVVLRVDADQANYMRTLPLHESQKEVERTPNYSIFTLKIRPTFDFIQELLWNGAAVEVVEPQWLRNEMKDMASEMLKKYL